MIRRDALAGWKVEFRDARFFALPSNPPMQTEVQAADDGFVAIVTLLNEVRTTRVEKEPLESEV